MSRTLAASSTINMKSFKHTDVKPILVICVKLLLVPLLSMSRMQRSFVFCGLFTINARITSRRQENRIFLFLLNILGGWTLWVASWQLRKEILKRKSSCGYIYMYST
jgi:hypothetical protein